MLGVSDFGFPGFGKAEILLNGAGRTEMCKVIVVGTGVGPEDLTEAHRRAIEAAEVLVGGKRQLAMFAGEAEATWTLGGNPRATLEEVKQEAAHGFFMNPF